MNVEKGKDNLKQFAKFYNPRLGGCEKLIFFPNPKQ